MVTNTSDHNIDIRVAHRTEMTPVSFPTSRHGWVRSPISRWKSRPNRGPLKSSLRRTKIPWYHIHIHSSFPSTCHLYQGCRSRVVHAAINRLNMDRREYRLTEEFMIMLQVRGRKAFWNCLGETHGQGDCLVGTLKSYGLILCNSSLLLIR